jgi:hypothetical protein
MKKEREIREIKMKKCEGIQTGVGRGGVFYEKKCFCNRLNIYTYNKILKIN